MDKCNLQPTEHSDFGHVLVVGYLKLLGYLSHYLSNWLQLRANGEVCVADKAVLFIFLQYQKSCIYLERTNHTEGPVNSITKKATLKRFCKMYL